MLVISDAENCYSVIDRVQRLLDVITMISAVDKEYIETKGRKVLLMWQNLKNFHFL